MSRIAFLGFAIWIGAYNLAIATEVTIGTGSGAGLYYQVGRAICRLVNTEVDQHDIHCLAPSSPGSITNLRELRSGRLQVGIAQSDWQYHAYHGTSRFSDAGPDENLRSLFSVHSEPFTLVARRDSGIKSFDDLVGKRVNIGNSGSGQRATMEVVMAAKGWSKSVFSLANELPASQQSLALCHDRVQAMVYTVGHPNPSVMQAARLCDAVIVDVSGDEITKLVDDNVFYTFSEVPGGLYPGNPEPVSTFGVRATVVASSALADELAYALVKAVFDDFEQFKAMHPAFSQLSKEGMVKDGLSAPLHDGAQKYFREHGLIDQ